MRSRQSKSTVEWILRLPGTHWPSCSFIPSSCFLSLTKAFCASKSSNGSTRLSNRPLSGLPCFTYGFRVLRRRTRTSEAVSPSKFAFQSLDEGASISYSQSSNESVKVQRSSNAFSFPTYTLTCQERSVEVVPAIKRIHSHTKAVFLSSNEGFERIRYQADTIQ